MEENPQIFNSPPLFFLSLSNSLFPSGVSSPRIRHLNMQSRSSVNSVIGPAHATLFVLSHPFSLRRHPVLAGESKGKGGGV